MERNVPCLANEIENDIKNPRSMREKFRKEIGTDFMERGESDASKIRIWIAEDDEELREILGSSLSVGQREVRLFENGQAVLEAIKDSPFDILVTDLMMPGADGIEVLHEVKRLRPESVVILMTGYASLDSAIQAIRGGAYDYIRKPFKLDEMEIALQNACEKITLLRENQSLLQRLKEAMGEVSRLKGVWDGHLAHLIGMVSMISDDPRDEEMELILRQINPLPPGGEWKEKKGQERALDGLERLVQFRKEGFLTEEEFLVFKKRFFQNLDRLK